MVETGAFCAGDYRMRSLYLGAREMEEVDGEMKHDFIKAHEILERHNKWRRGDDTVRMADPAALGAAIDIALHALLIADRLTQNPSTAMLEAATESVILGEDANGKNVHLSDVEATNSFKAMRDQMLREVGA